MKTEGVPGPAEEGSPNEHKPNLKERAVHGLAEFLGMFIYLWVLFAMFVIHQSIILAEQHLNYQAQGFAIVNEQRGLLLHQAVPGQGKCQMRFLLSHLFDCIEDRLLFLPNTLLHGRPRVLIYRSARPPKSLKDVQGEQLGKRRLYHFLLSLDILAFIRVIPIPYRP